MKFVANVSKEINSCITTLMLMLLVYIYVGNQLLLNISFQAFIDPVIQDIVLLVMAECWHLSSNYMASHSR
jgi:hypothetical protein